MVWFLLACVEPPPESGAVPGCAPGRVVAATTDFGVGALAVLDDQGVVDTLAPTSGDPLVEAAGCDVLQADRAGGDRLRRWTGTDWTAPAWEVALPTGVNVHGLALAEDRVWVAGWGESALLGLNAQTGATETEVDLSAYSDADGLPELEDVLVRDGRLWVAAQRFDQSTWLSTDGRVLGVDPVSGDVELEVVTGPSPFLYPVRGEDRLLLQTGTYYTADGGLHWLDLTTGELSPLWDAPDEDIVGLAGSSDALAVLSSTLDGGTYRVWCMDPSTGERTLAHETGAFLTDVVVDASGLATVAVRRNVDASGEPGLLRLDLNTCAMTTAEPLATLLEPWDLILSEPGADQ